MSSQLKSLLESRRLADLAAVAAEGNMPNAKAVTVLGRNIDLDTSAEDITDGGGDYAFPTAARVHALVSSSVEDGDDADAATGTITIADYAECAAAAASGTVTYGVVVDTETITIDGTTFTKAAAGSGTEFSTIAELTALINALPNVNATDNGTVITIVAAVAGTAGNSITMAETSAIGLTLSGATLAGGEAVVTVTVNGVAFVAGTDFTAATSNTATATSLRAAINASADVLIDGILTAGGSGANVTITADTGGTAGNSITLATSETDAVTVSGATLTGGDAANTTGVLSVRITGVDADYAELVEDVTLGGTVSVNTVGSFLRINKIETLTVGSNGSAVGNITATAATDATVTARILAGNNQSFNAVYTVPDGKTAFMLSMTGSLPNATSMSAVITLLAKTSTLAAYFTKHVMGVTATGTQDNRHVFDAPLCFTEKTDIKLRVATSGNNADVVAGMQLLVVADEQ